MRKSILLRCALSASTFGLIAATPAIAHEVDETGEPAESGQAEYTGAAAEGEIIVTARRREERLHDVPIAITALSGEVLKNNHADSVMNLPELVPGFTASRNFSVFLPNVRGIGSTGVSLTDEANVALYVDGVYQPSPLGNIVDLVEVERVEVLRGPQGTLFGRNATGGLVNIITPEPAFQTRGRIAAQYGRFGGANEGSLKGYFTTPLADNVAVDVAGLFRKNGGYLDDLVRGSQTGNSRLGHVRGQLLFEPTERSKIIFGVSYNNSRDRSGNAIQPIGDNNSARTLVGAILPDEPYEVSQSVEPLIHIRASNLSLRTSFELGAVTLATTTGYLRDHIFQKSDNDATNIAMSDNVIDLHNEAFSQEIRLLSNHDGPFSWIVGAYYYVLDANAEVTLNRGVAPAYVTKTTQLLSPTGSVDSWAGFAEAILAVTDKLNVTIGTRYTTEKRRWDQFVNGNRLFTVEQAFTSDKWTYRGILQYKFDEDSNVYASYSTGFKSGVFNTYSTIATPTKPEQLEATELGVKLRTSGGARMNLVMFHYDYSDYQVVAREPGGSVSRLLNADKAKVKGAEFELDAPLGDSLSIRGTATLLDGEYTAFPNAIVYVPLASGGNAATVGDVSGNNLISAPKFTASLGANWVGDLGGGELRLTGNVYYSAKVYYDFGNRLTQPDYATISGEVSWTSPGGTRFYIYGRNLTDNAVLAQGRVDAFGDSGTYIRPREVGAGLEFRF